MTVPIVVNESGLQPQTPAALLAQLIALVSATNPGYTANLPGSLVEDISSTDVGAITLCDSALVELVNSLTPYGANAFLLTQLGNLYGVPQNPETVTSVSEVFTGPPGFVIAQGFTVSDGTYQYVAQDGGVIGAGGTSQPLFFTATTVGSWAVLSSTVNQIVTPPPSGVTLTVTNPEAGTPGTGAESEADYRSRVLQAGQAIAQGVPTFLKTQLSKVPGVQARLISVLQQSGGGWEIICGGGDPYEVGYAIYQAIPDISTLVGSTLSVSGITSANPGVVTTTLNHGFSTGQVIQIIDSNPTAYNGTYTITVITETTFSLGVNTSGFAAYVGSAVVTPNLRNESVSLDDYPNTYVIPFVNPPQQTVTIAVTWNTTSTNFVSSASVAQLGAPAIADYVNAISAGQPMNLFELQDVFQTAIASILSPALLTRMVFSVNINGVGVAPIAGTGIIAGDPESYFLTTDSQITFIQG